jgi:hypothetical protein
VVWHQLALVRGKIAQKDLVEWFLVLCFTALDLGLEKDSSMDVMKARSVSPRLSSSLTSVRSSLSSSHCGLSQSSLSESGAPCRSSSIRSVLEILPSLVVGPILNLYLRPRDLYLSADQLVVLEASFVHVAWIAVSIFWICIWSFLEAYACKGLYFFSLFDRLA